MDNERACRIARDAYVYGLPFLSLYRLFILQAATGGPVMMGAGFNKFFHRRQVMEATMTDTSQQDTLYSAAVLDLRREPMVLSVPAVGDEHAYMIQILDTSTETLPYVSTLTTGNKASTVALVGPDFQGVVPTDGVDAVLTTRGRFVAFGGRTAVLDPDDLAPLHTIQDGFHLRPLSEFLGTEAPLAPPELDLIPWDPEKAAGLGSLDYLAMALAWHVPSGDEIDLLSRFAEIGVVPGARFSTEGLAEDTVAALAAGVADARAEIEARSRAQTDEVNGWTWGLEDMSRFGSDYLKRASVALKTIGPNEPRHAVYGSGYVDADGQSLHGRNTYTVTFPAGGMPPVHWFWSLTMYNEHDGSMYPNPTGRTTIGDRTKGIKPDADGSLTITITHEAPADTSNWLPAPDGPIYLVLRLYGPTDEVLDGSWTPPAIRRVG